MTMIAKIPSMPMAMVAAIAGPAAFRTLLIGLVAFLTVVDLFATQAILPTLTRAYGVSPAAMGFAVNASTIGMALAGLGIALVGRKIDRRRGIVLSLMLLAVPTALLAVAPGLAIFTALRILQGLCMASAFTLTLTYLAERSSAREAAAASAAYVTGNVASNLFGRLLSAAVAEHWGLATNFYLFAALNLLGALLVSVSLRRAAPMERRALTGSPLSIWAEHLRNRPLRASFGVGFCILFAFIGTFTFVNFVLVREPLSISPMQLGFVYFVFLPSILTTPLAGHAAHRFGTRKTVGGGLLVAAAGLPLLLLPNLAAVLIGLAMIGVGTFFAQAAATGFIGRTATTDRGSASGIYLACYFGGGLVGTALLGQAFDRLGWEACIGCIGIALVGGMMLAVRLKKHPAGA
jgi:MFS transporter, YNFM family, putative membrane transport protein